MKVEVGLSEKKEVPPRSHRYQGEMGSGPSLGDICSQVSFGSALLSTWLESCLSSLISTFGLSAGTNFSLYYRSNRCGLWTIVAQSYEFYSLILQAFCGPYTTYVHHAYCIQPCPLESSMGGLALNLIELEQSCFIHFGYSSCVILMIKYLMFKKTVAG